MGTIAIIGSGVVGQATGKGFASMGNSVIFCDTKAEVRDRLSKDGYQVCTPENLPTQEIRAFFLSVPTPTKDGKIDFTYLESSSRSVGKALATTKEYVVVVVRSTVLPGTTENLVIPILEKESGKKAGKDFGVCMNPEFLRENRNEEDFKKPWIILIGELDQKSGAHLEKLYGKQSCPIAHVSLADAEAEKYVHNLWNACKIAFFNEMRAVCEASGADADTIFPIVMKSAEASWNSSYGIRNMGPFGGNCLPKDTQALLSWARENKGLSMTLLDGIIKSNDEIERNLSTEK